MFMRPCRIVSRTPNRYPRSRKRWLMKKLLAFVVVLSVGLFTFAGCGETKKTPPKDGGKVEKKEETKKDETKKDETKADETKPAAPGEGEKK